MRTSLDPLPATLRLPPANGGQDAKYVLVHGSYVGAERAPRSQFMEIKECSLRNRIKRWFASSQLTDPNESHEAFRKRQTL
jgi:hypothetical protein